MKDLRYLVEHRVLPANLFEDEKVFIVAISKDRADFIAEIYRIVGEDIEVKSPYLPEDFKVNTYRISDNCFMIQIVMPKPKMVPQCYKEYIMFDDEFKNVQYFTIEMGEEQKNFMCSWNREGCHLNYGTIPADEESEINKILSIYMK